MRSASVRLRTRLLGPALVPLVLATAGCARAAPAVTPRPTGSPTDVLRFDLSRVFDAPIFDQSIWAVQVRSLDTGAVLFERHPSTFVMPASNMKIVTLAAAAERLGWDHRFETDLVSTAPVVDGVLRGDLVVVGDGDPSINQRDGHADQVFDQWASGLHANGVSTIAGRLVADDGAFEDERLGAGWSWDDLAYGYAAPVSALQFDENLVRLTVRAGQLPGDPVAIDIQPPDSGLVVTNRLETVAGGDRPSIRLLRLPGQSRLEVAGTVPAGAEPFSRTASIDDPTVRFARAAKAALGARGIDFLGDAVAERGVSRDAHADGTLRTLASSLSPPLSDVATVLMKVSQNLYAETLLRALGRQAGVGSVDGGLTAVREVLADWDLDPDDCVQYDGSGLSRYNYVTADLLVRVLMRLYQDPRHKQSFLATLPVAGRDGTMADRLRETRAENNVRAKTGTMANARALSGYVTTRDGEVLAFSIIANNFTLPFATIDYTADIAVETLANFTRR